ncbi:zinc-ribbon domain-containing protein [Rhodoplanes sp. TEM]|uniref:Zinc-ribbon domain-containing protein n=1 Tax=Rhodoplanes tepidamans TaxID=200616 RepID=A0ABT5JAK6_RHOTP|nr:MULTISPECIES: MJ0042-type zinc finger domain-containing protein [Rhodoplanes]MDC7786517.1 zinc-ribbon domain-containing protein [Rhodoplanes tepidamans]MDC7983145.1 zinc-ribbon domain-containing protein [Rhodoplanes sp. TEM]MDQ0357603.1 putative Zn finger-like uncharacterized protein [Rhodoplanes tepidamans]
MKIVCPQCEAWYEVPEASVGRGRTVRCVECRTVWTATAEDAIRAEEAARRRAAARQEAARQEAAREQAARLAAEPEPAFAAADAGSAGGPGPGPAPAGAAGDDDGWPDDLSPPKDPPPDADATAEADATTAVADAPSVVPEHDAFALPDGPTRDWDAEFEAAEARRLAREQAGPKTRRGLALPKPSWATVALSLMVVIGVVLAWRVDVVRALPQTGALFAKIGLPVNLRGLAFDAVKVETDMSDNVPVLVVEGVVLNVSKVRIDVPRLRFSMRDASGAEIHTWTAMPTRPSLAPGEAQPFRTRLASPPSESREVFVRFFTRRDR